MVFILLLTATNTLPVSNLEFFLLSIIIKSFFIVDTFIARTFKFKKYRPTLDEIQCRNAISR